MRGKITNYNQEKRFGFVRAEDENDYFFHFSEVKDERIQCRRGETVTFELRESRKNVGKMEASNLSLIEDAGKAAFKMPKPYVPSSYLTSWASIELFDQTNDSGKIVAKSDLRELAEMALSEEWGYPNSADDRDDLYILRKYVRYTFHRLWKEGKVKEVSVKGHNYAAFNTGLVNNLFDPIFALFEPSNWGQRPWKFRSFCCVNRGKDGDVLGEYFNPLPAPAKYFSKSEEVVFDPDVEIIPDWDHIIQDAIERDRYPVAFLEENCPKDLDFVNVDEATDEEWKSFLKKFRKAIDNNPAIERRIKRRVEDSIDVAVKRARWNFKTAIPLYYAPQNRISLLLPVGLESDECIDAALVITRTAAGGYTAETMYYLSWAYEQARLICRPQSDWLTLDKAAESILVDEAD